MQHFLKGIKTEEPHSSSSTKYFNIKWPKHDKHKMWEQHCRWLRRQLGIKNPQKTLPQFLFSQYKQTEQNQPAYANLLSLFSVPLITSHRFTHQLDSKYWLYLMSSCLVQLALHCLQSTHLIHTLLITNDTQVVSLHVLCYSCHMMTMGCVFWNRHFCWRQFHMMHILSRWTNFHKGHLLTEGFL